MNTLPTHFHSQENPACPILEIRLERIGLWSKTRRIPVCPQLTTETLTVIFRRINRRNPDLESIARDAMARESLPGLVILWRIAAGRGGDHATRPLDIPSPLMVPFDPLELDQRDSDLVSLCCDAPGRPVVAARPKRDWEPLLRLPTIAFMGFWLYKAFQSNLVMALCGLVAVIVPMILEWIRPRWHILPGGVIAPTRLWDLLGQSLSRYTPADTILVIKGEWKAELHHGGLRASMCVTDFECSALLAAWLSPLKAVKMDSIADAGAPCVSA